MSVAGFLEMVEMGAMDAADVVPISVAGFLDMVEMGAMDAADVVPISITGFLETNGIFSFSTCRFTDCIALDGLGGFMISVAIL